MLIAIIIICSVLTIVIGAMRATKLHKEYKEERRLKEEFKKNTEADGGEDSEKHK